MIEIGLNLGRCCDANSITSADSRIEAHVDRAVGAPLPRVARSPIVAGIEARARINRGIMIPIRGVEISATARSSTPCARSSRSARNDARSARTHECRTATARTARAGAARVVGIWRLVGTEVVRTASAEGDDERESS